MNYNINDYQIKISKLSPRDGGGYVAVVPELPGCMSDGETYEEALTNVKEAINDWIDTAKARGQSVPEPMLYQDDEDYSGKLIIRIPKKLHKELSESADEQGISLNQLILYYLSKQTGSEEIRKVNLLDKVDNQEKENKILNVTLINYNKDWKPLQSIPQQFIMPAYKRGE